MTWPSNSPRPLLPDLFRKAESETDLLGEAPFPPLPQNAGDLQGGVRSSLVPTADRVAGGQNNPASSAVRNDLSFPCKLRVSSDSWWLKWIPCGVCGELTRSWLLAEPDKNECVCNLCFPKWARATIGAKFRGSALPETPGPVLFSSEPRRYFLEPCNQ